MRTSAIIFFIGTTFLFIGCSKKVTPVVEFEGGRLEVNEMDFEYFQGKTRITYNDPENEVDAKATIRIKKDSVIWMNFSSAGITGVRCLIVEDSITIMNTLKDEYFTFSYPELSQRFNFNIDFETVQAAALGNLILARQQSDMASSLDTAMVLKQRTGSVSIENYIHKESHKILLVNMRESSSMNQASITYRDFQFVNDQYFPFSGIITLFYQTQNATFNTTLEFEYSKAEIIDKELKFPFKIPKKYVGR